MSDEEFVKTGLLAAIETASNLEKRIAALERENAALRAQDAWLVATFGNREDENQKLRAELEAQAVVNGKGSEREAKLLAEVAVLKSDRVDNLAQIYKLGVENDQLRLELENVKQDRERMMERHDEQIDEAHEENAALRKDKERLDWIIGEAHYLFFKELASDLAKGRQQIDAARKEAQP